VDVVLGGAVGLLASRRPTADHRDSIEHVVHGEAILPPRVSSALVRLPRDIEPHGPGLL
jgi:hypothetical protein